MLFRKLLLTILILSTLFVRSQNVGINTTGAAPAATNLLEVLQTSTTASSVGIYSAHSGAITGTGYGIWIQKTGASTTNVAGYFSASGATNNYAIIVPSGGGIVGIGTSSPSILGTSGIDISGTTSVLHLKSSDATSYSELFFQESSTIKGAIIVTNSTHATDANSFQIFGASGYSFRFMENVTENMTIKTGGDVGIGTGLRGTPEARLEIQNTEGNDASLALDADDGDDNADTWFIKSQAADNDLTITNHATELMRITDGGAVGIGTAAAPSDCSILDISSSTKGILIPRVALTDVTVFAPATGTATDGLMVYSTARPTGGSGTGFYYWSTGSSQWIKVYDAYSGGGYTLQYSFTSSNLADNLSYYFGEHPTFPIHGSSGVHTFLIPKDGILKVCTGNFIVSGTLASLETCSLYIEDTGTATGTLITNTLQLNSTQHTFRNSAMSLRVSQGDAFELRIDTPTFTTNPVAVYGSVTLYIE